MLNYRNLKTEAKSNLKGKTRAIKAASLFQILLFHLSTFPVFFMMTSLLVNPNPSAGTVLSMTFVSMAWALLIFGLMPMFRFSLVKMTTDVFKTGKAAIFSDFFRNFRYFGKAQGIYWWTYLWIYIWRIASMAPLYILTIIAAILKATSQPGFMIPLAVSALYVIPMTVFLIYKNVTYQMNIYLAAFDLDLGPVDATNLSKAITGKKIWNLFGLNISFIGWVLLGIMTLGISLAFTGPYIMGTYVLAGDELKREYAADKQEATDK